MDYGDSVLKPGPSWDSPVEPSYLDLPERVVVWDSTTTIVRVFWTKGLRVYTQKERVKTEDTLSVFSCLHFFVLKNSGDRSY